jgi:non-specific serine/threonine protein kinase
VEPALTLASGAWRFWQMRGYLSEGLDRVRQALAMPGVEHYPRRRADALEAAGGLAYWLHEPSLARGWYEEALAIRRSLGDRAGEAEALYNLSFTFSIASADAGGDPERAAELIGEALALFRATGDRAGTAKALWALSNADHAARRWAQAHERGLEALALFREQGNAFMAAWTLYTLAVNAMAAGSATGVDEQLREALRLFVDADDRSGYALVLDAFACLALRSGATDRAARLSGAVEELERATGTGLNLPNRELLGFDPAPLRSRPEWAAGARMAVADVIAYALGEAGAAAS